jgi:type IV secretory pathway TrbF-like protein
MFRKPDQEPMRHEDILSRGHEDWDNRVSLAIAGQTAWKRALYATLGILAVSVSSNVWQAQQSKVQVVHIVHDSIGGVIAVSASSDEPGDPTQVMLKAALEQWIVNIRSVYIDALAMRSGILAAYDLVDARSQAAAALGTFYTGQDPFKRAETETVSLENVVAVPPTAATIGPDGMQTWRMTWVEHITSRDGQNETRQAWAGNITFKLKRPAAIQDAYHNPDGIHILAYSWTGGPR